MRITNARPTTPAGTLTRALLLTPFVAAGPLALTPGAVLVGAAGRHSAIADVRIDAASWVVAAPARIPVGLVRFTLKSQPSPMPPRASIARLKPGVSRAQVVALRKGDEMGLNSLTTGGGEDDIDAIGIAGLRPRRAPSGERWRADHRGRGHHGVVPAGRQKDGGPMSTISD